MDHMNKLASSILNHFFGVSSRELQEDQEVVVDNFITSITFVLQNNSGMIQSARFRSSGYIHICILKNMAIWFKGCRNKTPKSE